MAGAGAGSRGLPGSAGLQQASQGENDGNSCAAFLTSTGKRQLLHGANCLWACGTAYTDPAPGAEPALPLKSPRRAGLSADLPTERVQCCPPPGEEGSALSSAWSRLSIVLPKERRARGATAAAVISGDQGNAGRAWWQRKGVLLSPSRPRCFTTPRPLPMDAPWPPLTQRNSTGPSLLRALEQAPRTMDPPRCPSRPPLPAEQLQQQGSTLRGPHRTDPSRPTPSLHMGARPGGLRPPPPLSPPVRDPVTLPSPCRAPGPSRVPSPPPAHSGSAPGHCPGTAGLCRAELAGTGGNGVPRATESPDSGVGTTRPHQGRRAPGLAPARAMARPGAGRAGAPYRPAQPPFALGRASSRQPRCRYGKPGPTPPRRLRALSLTEQRERAARRAAAAPQRRAVPQRGRNAGARCPALAGPAAVHRPAAAASASSRRPEAAAAAERAVGGGGPGRRDGRERGAQGLPGPAGVCPAPPARGGRGAACPPRPGRGCQVSRHRPLQPGAAWAAGGSAGARRGGRGPGGGG